MERRVEQRTVELNQANESLRLQIQERERSEAERRQTDATLSVMSEITPAMVLVHQDGKCRFANAATETLLGRPRAEILEHNFWEFVHPDARDLVRERGLKRAAGENMPFRYEFPVITSSGEKRWIDCSSVRIELQGKAAVLACALDVTERNRADEKLRASELRFRQVVEHIREVFWMSDLAKNQIHYVSPAYEEVWGRSCASLYDSPRDWVEAIHPDDRDRVLRAALTKQVGGDYHEVYRIIRPDGAIRWIDDRGFPVRDESGGVYRVVGIAEDITARKRAAAQRCPNIT
jgi:PAS domain S-box-containing protein